jgi:hypothetical protein
MRKHPPAGRRSRRTSTSSERGAERRASSFPRTSEDPSAVRLFTHYRDPAARLSTPSASDSAARAPFHRCHHRPERASNEVPGCGTLGSDVLATSRSGQRFQSLDRRPAARCVPFLLPFHQSHGPKTAGNPPAVDAQRRAPGGSPSAQQMSPRASRWTRNRREEGGPLREDGAKTWSAVCAGREKAQANRVSETRWEEPHAQENHSHSIW